MSEQAAVAGDPLARPLTGLLERKADATALEKHLGIRTVGELLWHLPRRHYGRGELTPLSHLEVGQYVTIAARIQRVDFRKLPSHGKPRSRTIVTVADGTSLIRIVFFNLYENSPIVRSLQPGAYGMFSGTVGEFGGELQLTQPEWDPVDEGSEEEWAGELVAVYPAVKGMPSARIRRIVREVLDQFDAGSLPDALPDDVRERESLLPFGQALSTYHRAQGEEELERARRTLAWHEALLLQTFLVAQRRAYRDRHATPREAGALLERLDASLPFPLTPDQQAAGEAIAADLVRPTPMHRLLQGEVGSGKTLVALRAMLQVAESGGQAAMLAPTEVLASQHLRSLAEALGPDLASEVGLTLLTGQQPATERKRAALQVASGTARIVVGTHALVAEGTQFADLGLVIIDEQHRFGVRQRESLRAKGASPHTLLMTATPIPRTVAMTAFGDLDVSELRTLPAGRAPVQSAVLNERESPQQMGRLWQRVRADVDAGRQAYVVCPAVRPGEEGQFADVETTIARLQNLQTLQGVRIAPLFGSMPAADKDATMRAFAAGDIDLLVATTVIEVGVNVPNATTMVILDADRFGLAQLHQLRGRVARGTHPGLCVLVTSAAPGTPAADRVAALAETTDGFEIAELDLAHRGEGDMLGERQSGALTGLRVLQLTGDADIIESARELATGILEEDPSLTKHAALRAEVLTRLDDESRDALRTA